MEIIKKNITFIVGASIPILMILFVAGSIYLPGIFIKPKYNFLYLVESSSYYYNKYQYSVQNGALIRSETQRRENPNYNLPQSKSTLYIYDVVKNESKEISFEQTQYLNFDSNAVSPDGFEIVYGSRSNSFFPFFFWSENDYDIRYLKGHNVSKKLQLNGPSFRFIGWIK
ncbi:MAG: hypothetical protein AAB706_03825 [Patescibacteria group bacterium]